MSQVTGFSQSHSSLNAVFFFSSVILSFYLFIFLPVAKKCLLTDKKLHRLKKSLALSQAHHILNSIVNMLTGGNLLLFSALGVKCLTLLYSIFYLTVNLINSLGC